MTVAILNRAPRWLLRPLSAFAVVDDDALQQIVAIGQRLPDSMVELDDVLKKRQHRNNYDAAANLANAMVWEQMNAVFRRPDLTAAFCDYCQRHFPHAGLSRVIRRMIVHPRLQNYGKRLRMDSDLYEASLSTRRWGPGSSIDWNTNRRTRRYAGSSKRRIEQGVPDVATVGELRELLQIRSPAQLGFFLSAVAHDNGPYTTFEISKRSGESREIAAPCTNLLWVQRRILRKILASVPPDEAAHGFVPGRSTASNAAPHVGANLILKFDLRDFFPTISEHRVVGLFASMGYHVGAGRYQTDDRSHDLAPVLARLCCHSPKRGSAGVLPQGAPTSPALSNLICRRLDQRLTGLVKKFNGAYTRYADDLTFSFHDSIQVGRFRWWVDQICFQEGFTVRQDKFRAIRASQQQQVTGIVVNQRMNVPRRTRRNFRAMLHQCRRDGLESMEQRQPGIRGYMRGFAAYVNMVDPTDQGALLQEVAVLLGGPTQ